MTMPPQSSHHRPCPDCQADASLDRRRFLTTVGTTALSAFVVPQVLNRVAYAAPSPQSAAETTVARFYQSLTPEQRRVIVLPFEHELRHKINANWHVTKPTIGEDFYTSAQRQMIREILQHTTSPDGFERILKQLEDDSGGLEFYSVGIFGTPGAGKFEFMITGRHLTLRADGDSVEHAAFGGPIVYGHGAETPKENLFYYQTQQVNEVFKALDGRQRERALLDKAPRETDVALQGPRGAFAGIPLRELSADQKVLVEQTLKVLLAPYRQEDVDEVMAILRESGGLDHLHLAFYRQDDLEKDQVWDIWRVEGPNFVWHFRGAPHVHAYINIGVKS
ncbi:MAG: hypothetical protein KatS3mg114_0195 [Planctomycetaceae bacterium]|nr:MAG: hypothetical protein KatS3mg114_0195 [Planctomycetaceae bacterium]